MLKMQEILVTPQAMRNSYSLSLLALLIAATASAAPDFSRDLSDGPVHCFDAALGKPGMPKSHTIELCAGAESAAPVECYQRASDELGLNQTDSRNLCLAAATTAPVDCFKQARERSAMSKTEALTACTGATTASGVSECFEVIRRDSELNRLAKLVICAGAADVKPAQCYQGARIVRQLGLGDSLELCRTRDRFRP